MSTKEELLILLETQRGQMVSGADLAAQLGVTRAAVWKAAEALRKEGMPIESVSGSGYRLSPQSDVLSVQGIAAHLEDPHTPVKLYKDTDSTNTIAKQWAIEGAPHGSLVLAERQAQGRGRLGRSFASPPGGIYMSIVLRPQAGDGQAPPLITAATAVAVCRAVRALCGIELSIKWVNDLYLGTKKCCGILSEASTNFEDGSIEYIVVGIGLNFRTRLREFPADIARIATSLYPHGTAPMPRVQLVSKIHSELMAAFSSLHQKEFLPEYRGRSNILGKPITVLAATPYPATVVDIDDEARLLVQYGDEVFALSSGEVSISPIQNGGIL